MKKYMIMAFSVITVIGLSGCGGGSSKPPSSLTTLFLVDDQGFSYGGIPYKCDSMYDWGVTQPNGEFSFYPGEDCVFDLYGLDGDYNINPIVDDVVRIVDYTYDGKGGIDYECASFGVGTTFSDGSFFYDIDDTCEFYL
jgi:hypothetical protein